MAEIYHALGLHFHQPLGNLIALHNSPESWEARQILWCYDRPTRMIEGYEDIARLHLSFSGTLLKQLEDPGLRQTFQDIVNIEDFLNRSKSSAADYIILFIRSSRARSGTCRPIGGRGSVRTCSAASISPASGRPRWVSAWT
jgi:hypothetical protein